MSEDLNTLLDMQLDDLEDMPSFQAFPNGAHVCTIAFESKVINKEKALELKLVAVETSELEDPATDKPLKAGDETTVLYQLNNEFGQGSLKEVLKPLSAATGITNVGQLLEAVKGMQALVVTKRRADKNDKDKFYTGIKSIQLI